MANLHFFKHHLDAPKGASNIGLSRMHASALSMINGEHLLSVLRTAPILLLFLFLGAGNIWGVTFSFTSAPSGWPTSESADPGGSKTYTVSGTTYTFSLGPKVYYTSSYLMLKYTTYLGLPALTGYKLTGVTIHNSSGCSTTTKVTVTTSSDGATAVSGGALKTLSTRNQDYSWTLSGTSANTMYYLYITNKNCQITSITLTYESAGKTCDLDAPSVTTSEIRCTGADFRLSSIDAASTADYVFVTPSSNAGTSSAPPSTGVVYQAYRSGAGIVTFPDDFYYLSGGTGSAPAFTKNTTYYYWAASSNTSCGDDYGDYATRQSFTTSNGMAITCNNTPNSGFCTISTSPTTACDEDVVTLSFSWTLPHSDDDMILDGYTFTNTSTSEEIVDPETELLFDASTGEFLMPSFPLTITAVISSKQTINYTGMVNVTADGSNPCCFDRGEDALLLYFDVADGQTVDVAGITVMEGTGVNETDISSYATWDGSDNSLSIDVSGRTDDTRKYFLDDIYITITACTDISARTVTVNTVTPVYTTQWDATVTWGAISGADRYAILLQSWNGSAWQTAVAGQWVYTTSKTFENLTEGTKYRAQVVAHNKSCTPNTYTTAAASNEFIPRSSCPGFSFHYGNDGAPANEWTIECFGAAVSHVCQISDFQIPSSTHFYVGYQGTYTSGNSSSTTAPNSSTLTWSSLYFDASIGDGSRPMVGQATGAVGTVKIIDNSDWTNKKASFIPNGYVLKFGSSEYPFTVHNGNEYRSSVVTYNSAATNYSVSVGVEDSDGDYVSTDNTAEMRHIFLNTGGTSLWSTGNASNFALYDDTEGHKYFTCLMVQVPGEDYLYEGWVPASCTQIIICRMASTTLEWGEKNSNVWNYVVSQSLPNDKNLFTIEAWSTGSWSAYTKKGQFRMNANYTDKNWYVRFVPHYVLTYDKNDENALGTMSVQTVAVDAASKSVTVAANGFTAPTGYQFNGWKTAPSSGTSYAAGASYTLSADATLYAQWQAIDYNVIYSAPSNGNYTISVAGGAASSATKTANYGQTITLAASPNTGYEFTSWTVTGVTSGDNIAVSNNQFTMPAENVTVTATFTAIDYSVTYSAPSNGNYTIKVASGTASSATKTANYGQMITIAANANTGYQFTSWTITKTTGGDNVTSTLLTGDKPTTANTSFSMPDYGVTVTAAFGAKTYTINLDDEGADITSVSPSSVTVNYNFSTLSSAITNPDKTGHTFAGWYSGDDGAGVEVITTGGALKASVADYTGAGGIWTRDVNPTTLHAKWNVNSYKVTIESVDDVTISATTPSISEGNYGNANYNSTVTLSYTGITSGLTWGHWRVYKDGDESTTVTVTNNQFTMPDYDVKVSAVLYGDVMAWCNPDITVSDGFCLTSYYISGEASATNCVYTTAAAENLLTIVSTDLAGVDKLVVSYLNSSDEAVTLTSSPFRICNDGVSPANYNVADGGDGSSFTINVSGTCDLSYSIRYKPTAYNQMDNYKLRIVMKKGSDEIKTITRNLSGRSLPEEFVIAVKGGDQWYALPNTLAGTQGTQGSIVPIKITVDNPSGTPTCAVYAPNTAIYKGRAKYATANRSSMALTSTGSNYLQTSSVSDVYQMWLSSSGDDDDVDWYFKSSDRSVYEMAMDPVNSPSKKMGYYNAQYIGYHGDPSSDDIYLLPVTNKYTDYPASVTEWGRKSVILDVNAQTAASAAIHIEAEDAETASSFDETKTSVKGSDSKYNYTLSFETMDFSEHKGELLYIDWLDDGDNIIGGSQVTIPWIIATNSVMGEIDNIQAHWKDWEVHVLPGITLEADGNSFSAASNMAKINTLEIYPGATVKVTSGTLDVSSLMLRNGWTRAGTKKYDVARLYIQAPVPAEDIAGANLTVSKAYADWYIDFDQYYPVAVPWSVTTSDMSYKNSNSTAQAGVKMRYYDGASRATYGQAGVGEGANWKEYSRVVEAKTYKYPATLDPGLGYAMTAKRPTGKAFSIIRMPLTIPSASWTTSGEQGEVSSVHKDQVTITAHGVGEDKPAYTLGWNFIANPYMSIYQGPITHSVDDDYDVEYVNIPDIDFKNYGQYPVGALGRKLLPSSGFFIQAAATGTLTFGTTSRKPSAPSYRKEETTPVVSKQKAYIVLNNEDEDDMMGLVISEKYTDAYEINADLEKLLGDGNSLKTYMRYGDMNMAYVAINSALAQEWIPVTVQLPEGSEYTFSLHEASVVDELEGVYLIDYAAGNVITNLLDDNYSFGSAPGTISGRFAINAIVGEHNTPTGIDVINGGGDINSDKPFKFIYHEKVYIYHRGVIYDATGKRVKEINK